MPTIISSQGASRPAPRWWRNFERGMLLVMIPSTVLVLQSWKFDNELQATRIILIVNVLFTALIKFVGMLLVDTDDNYVSNLTASDQNKVEVNNPPIKPNT